MVTAIEGYAGRSKRTYQADGLFDIHSGIALFAIALINFAAIRSIASMHGPDFHTSRAYQDGNNFFIMSILLANALIMVSFRAMEPLKRRFVYPRMGYVQPRIVPEERRRMVLLAFVLIGLGQFVATRFALWGSPSFWTSNMSLVCIGFGIGIGLVDNFLKVGFARHLAVAGVSVVASTLLASAHLGWLQASLWFVIILGASLVLSGSIAFAKILRTPVLTEADA